MKKIIIGVDGMRCGMCESHVNDAVRKVGGVVKVKSSCMNNVTEVIVRDDVAEKEVTDAIEKQGYRVMAFRSEPFAKKRFFGLFGGK